MHCLPKLFSQHPFCFLKRPNFNQISNPGSPDYFVVRFRFANVPNKVNKILSYFFLAGAVERAVSTRTTTPIFQIGPTLIPTATQKTTHTQPPHHPGHSPCATSPSPL